MAPAARSEHRLVPLRRLHRRPGRRTACACAGARIPISPARAAVSRPKPASIGCANTPPTSRPRLRQGNWKDPRAFFRAGGFGEWRDWLEPGDAEEYDARVAALASPDLAAWTHLGRRGSGIDPSEPDDAR